MDSQDYFKLLHTFAASNAILTAFKVSPEDAINHSGWNSREYTNAVNFRIDACSMIFSQRIYYVECTAEDLYRML